MRCTRFLLGTAVAIAVAPLPSATAAVPAPSPVCVPRATPPTIAVTEVSRTVQGRYTDLTLNSAALGSPAKVVVLTPPGYDSSRAQGYPVLYLLHGHGGGQDDWRNHGVDTLMTDAHGVPLPVIVVMPDGGYDGFYSDWYGVDVDGHNGTVAPGWESFHIHELIPFVDTHFNTIANRAGRAIAGLSMGGFGSMSYAARHPELFASAASFSGAVHPDTLWPIGPLGLAIASNVPDRRQPDFCIWGDPVTQHANWQAHDPTEIAKHLRGLELFVSSGNGLPGPGDDPKAGPTEAAIYGMSRSFVTALRKAGITPRTHFYGKGVHAWQYWQRELQLYARNTMMPAFG